MARKILSDLITGVRCGIAWRLATSRLTSSHTPRPVSLPPCPEVVARTRVDAIRDGVASLLFLLWHGEMSLRAELHACKHALRAGYAWGQIYTGFGL